MIIILILILANGVFAMSEIAVVSARKTRLQRQADAGNHQAAAALELANQPERFLSAVQIGITAIGILSGTFGGARVAKDIAPYLEPLPVIGPYAEQISLGLVVVLITYLSLVLGELAPKQIALSNPERIASFVARPMTALARITSPIVSFLSISTRAILKVLNIKPSAEPPITEDELNMLMEQGAESGVFDPIEEEIVEQLFRVGDLTVNELMVDRTEMTVLHLGEPLDLMKRKMATNLHSRYPVAREQSDNIVGVVYVKDMLMQALSDEDTNLTSVLRPALLVPSGLPVYDLLERFKEAQTQIAFVAEEHGGIEGLITFNDLLQAIVGGVPEVLDPEEPQAVQRDDGSWLLDGMLPLEEFQLLLHVEDIPDEIARYHQTVGGLVMSQLGRVPQASDAFEWRGLKFEVVDMDWRRVDKVLVHAISAEEDG